MLEVNFSMSLGNFHLQSSFSTEKGVLGILGASGCGKSLTLKCIAGLQNPNEGTIILNGKTLFSSESKFVLPSRKRKIGYVFQNYALFPHHNLEENIMYGIRHLEKKERKIKTAEFVEKMQLNGLEKLYPSQLSGGQQQRAALARSLITQPDLLLLDEPFSALDTHIKYLLEKELINIIRNNFDGIIILVTHNVEEAYRICDKIMVMDEGRILQFAEKSEIINSPANLSVARITGCKNFLNVKVLQERNEEMVLEFKNNILKASKLYSSYSQNMIAGIRAHHLKLVSEESTLENTFECDILEIIEGVHLTTLLVDFFGSQLQLEVSNTSCPHLVANKKGRIKVHIPPGNFFLMEE